MTHLKCLITAYRSADHLAYTSLYTADSNNSRIPKSTFQSTTDWKIPARSTLCYSYTSMKYVRSTSDEARLRQTAIVEYHFYPHCATHCSDESHVVSNVETRDKEVAEQFEGAMINGSNPLCNNNKQRWKLGYSVSGNSFARVRLQASYAF